MSNITTIKDIGSMEGGDLIKCIKVKVKSVYPPKKGSNEWGDWKIQSAMVEDETGTIRASFYDFEKDIKHFQGGVITVTAGKDGKGHQSGIEVYDYEDRKKNTVTRQLKINSNATIDEDVRSGQSSGGSVPGEASSSSAGGKGLPLSYADEDKRESIEKQVIVKAVTDMVVAQRLDPAGDFSFFIKTCNKIYDEFFAQPKAAEQSEPEAESEEKVI